MSIVFGAAGFVALAFFAVDSGTFSILARLILVVLPIALGWRVYSLSRVPENIVCPRST